MNKITESIIKFYLRDSDSETLVFRPHASDDDIDFIEKRMGVNFPSEMKDLYKIHNGIGMKSKTGEIYWYFHPLHNLYKFTVDIREYFNSTHPNAANSFFPIYDWNSGGALGYMLGSDQKWKKGLFEFDLENYENEPKQPLSEFLDRSHKSLYEFLAEH